MLFDTHSPGRRKFVQVLFFSMAVLMGFGLILFGIGSAVSGGGLVDAITGNGTNTSSQSDASVKTAKKASEQLAANPKDVAAAEDLAQARLVIATNDAFDPATGEIKKDGGQELITDATGAWAKYVALAPAKPNDGLAIQYAQFLASQGVNQYAQAARALQIVLANRKPTSGLYAQLAIYSLAAGQNDNYKEARARALALAPSATRRTEIGKALDDIKKQVDDSVAQQQKAQEAAGDSGTDSGTTPILPTLPTLQ